ncbi:MAG: twin-arginine translocase TatA/TatE family subunit [Myxococcota bacterium]
MGELLIILVIVVLVFGASRLPQLGEGVGKAIRNLKRGLNENDDIDVTPQGKQVEEGVAAVREEVAEADLVDRG